MSAKSETLSIMEACAYIEELLGHKPNPATVYRWTDTGLLASFSIGRRRFTTRTAVREMLEAFNAPKPAPQAEAEPSAKRGTRKAKGVKR
jgi:hypothetical protein